MKQIHGPEIDINNAEIFTFKSEYSYAAFTGVLSNIFMKAHASSVYISESYKAALVIDPTMLDYYKNQTNSSFERLKFLISKMKNPYGGNNLGIFLVDEDIFDKSAKIGLKHSVSQCWPMYNSKVEKDLITVNLPPSQLKSGENKVRYFSYNDIWGSLKGNIQIVDYDTPIKVLFDILERSKLHICYQGGTAWLSICMGIKTVIVHPKDYVNKVHLKHKLFGQDMGNINIINNADNIVHPRMHPCEIHTDIKGLKKIVNDNS